LDLFATPDMLAAIGAAKQSAEAITTLAS